jgi:hypothetical protein
VSFADQFGSQFGVIEYFSVKDDPDGAVLVVHGLMAAAQVDDAQAGVSQAGFIACVDACGVGSAVAHGSQHGIEQRFEVFFLPVIDDSGDTAHGGSLRNWFVVYSLWFLVLTLMDPSKVPQRKLATDTHRHPRTCGLCAQ